MQEDLEAGRGNWHESAAIDILSLEMAGDFVNSAHPPRGNGGALWEGKEACLV
jgi:hypothetical protein